MARLLGVDHGGRRTGLALSDPLGILASPLGEVAAATGEAMVARVVEAAREHQVERVVVGLPRHMDGTEGPRARAVRAFAAALSEALGPTSVELIDERLTTMEASEIVRRRRTRLTGDAHRATVNATAAQLILQTYLDGHKS